MRSGLRSRALMTRTARDGTQCIDGSCFDAAVGDPNVPPPPPPLAAPANLAAIAIDDRSVSLTWTNNDPAATDFQIERALDDGDVPQPVSPSGTISPSGTTDDSAGLQEGLTYVYRVRALADGQPPSDPSEISSATVLPATPVKFTATAAGNNQINLSWTNASTVATRFKLQERAPGGTFTDIPLPNPTVTNFPHTGLIAGTTHEYQVFAFVDGFEDSLGQTVFSLPSVVQSATTSAVFTTSFAPPPATLTTDETRLEGFCVVQRLRQTLLAPNVTGSQVSITLRGSTTASLTLDNVAISQVGNTGDPYDAAPDLTPVATAVTIPANTSVTLPPVNYTLDPTQDLLVAFDINNTSGGNPRFGALTGADSFANGPPGGVVTAEALVQNRTTGYSDVRPNNLYLIEKIEVL